MTPPSAASTTGLEQPPLVMALVAGRSEADSAIADGADIVGSVPPRGAVMLPEHDMPQAVAVAVVAARQGVRVVCTSAHVKPIRKAVDMVSSIAGTRPPARAVRGLA